MMYKRVYLLTIILLPLVCLTGCFEKGQVDQGRVVAFDKDKHTAVIIRDKSNDSQNPDYSYLPPLSYSLPTEHLDMGPDPKVGGRMKLDVEKSQIVIFNPAIQNFETIKINILDKKENIEKQDPLVYDVEKKSAKKLPSVDKEKGTVTIYSGRQKLLVTFSVPEPYLAMPENTWDSGDEARIYYKEAGKAIRFMNITKTDIFKG